MVQWVNDPAYLYCNIADSSCCLAQCVEYPMLPQLQLQFDSWSGNFHMLPGQPRKGAGAQAQGDGGRPGPVDPG